MNFSNPSANWTALVLAIFCSLWLSTPVNAEELSEEQKIDRLIELVSKSGATFIRNGSEHSATAAAAHMRLKLSRSGGMIKTAEHFIEYIATKSSFTGRPYYIQFPDGRKVKSADWLRARLAELEGAAADSKSTGDACCSVER